MKYSTITPSFSNQFACRIASLFSKRRCKDTPCAKSVKYAAGVISFRAFALALIICALSLSSCRERKYSNPDLDRLKSEIAQSEKYDNEKEERLNTLRTRLSRAENYEARFDLTNKLITEYEAYQCDSALHYANINIAAARSNRDSIGMAEAVISKCDILGRAGLFAEALDLINTIQPSELPKSLLQQYYSVSYSIYQYMSEYAYGTEYAAPYTAKIQQLCDSALKYSTPGTFDYLRIEAAKLINEEKYDAAIAKLDSAAKSYREGEREYSIIRSSQAFPENQIHPASDYAISLLAQASISDVKGSIKENMANRMLAQLLYSKGKVRGANSLVKKSMEDATFFAARMRSKQSGELLPLIDNQYNNLVKKNQNSLIVFICILACLAVILIIGFLLILRLLRRLRRANEQLKSSSEEIHALNKELLAGAEQTKRLNAELSEANNIKEAYLLQFIEMSSRSINSLEHFRKAMQQLLTAGKREDLKKALGSNTIVNEALKELYLTFDKAFLTIFPDFPSRLNELLRPEEHTIFSADEPFSTELRIYALVRMGISDSHRISEFLRCSLSTVYTYRSKMRARAIDPNTFEEQVLTISSMQKS